MKEQILANEKDKGLKDLIVLSDRSRTYGKSTVEYIKEKKNSKTIYDIEKIKLDGKTFSVVNGEAPSGKQEHFLEITDGKEHRHLKFDRKFSFEEAVSKVYENDNKKIGDILNQYNDYEKREKGTIKHFAEKVVNHLSEKADAIISQIASAKKMGHIQGVCECVAACGDDQALGKKLLSEMKVTKYMAKKYASPETYKTLEQGIFAQKPEQKQEMTQSRGRSM